MRGVRGGLDNRLFAADGSKLHLPHPVLQAGCARSSDAATTCRAC